MNSVRSRRMRAIGLFIVILALVLTFYNNWTTNKSAEFNTRESDKFYDELANTNRIRVDVNVKSMADVRNLITTQLDAHGANKLSSVEQNQFSTYIYQLNPEQVNPLLTEITRIGNITSKMEKSATSSSLANLDTKLKDREQMYQKAFQDYTNAKTYSRSTEKIDMLQAEIDSLKYLIANQKNTELTLLYLRARINTQHSGRLDHYRDLFFRFFRYLIMLTVGVALLYFGTLLLAYIFGILGVKFPPLSSILGKGYNDYAGYKGYRGYGSYGYGGSKKRKIKRIYRNKGGSHPEPEDNKQD